ncbi:MAG: sigma 54-interacting transcriptional regulator [Candidatus Rokubacteria bacterium]|nr:sigma 54-interacting transcriptional regulator [Candidatus Rokubacteria bacterium]
MTLLAEVIGESAAVMAVKDQLARLLARGGTARRLPPMLLHGETGTGKGLVARALHRASARRDGPFVDVNCAAIPDTLLEAEMFGFERGAFTDARQAKPGLFQTAHGGTIFLDEVGLLPEALQAKLLKVIEERTVRRLGSTRSEAIDAWIVCGTNEDLLEAIRARRFREDLYHRLAVMTVLLPPLRERGDDVLRLAEHFLARACADYGLPGKTLAPDARAALLAYPWPGNVRELANVMERGALLVEGRELSAAMLGLPDAPVALATTRSEAPPARLDDAVGAMERERLIAALEATGWNISRAAARLGITRNTLRYRIEKHDLRAGTPAPRREPRARPAAAPAPAPLAMQEPAAALAPLRWERRRATVLRADLLPGTGERAQPDLGRHLPTVVEKIHAFGGRIEELAATRVVGVFGVEPVEDAPRRAANAALAIRRAAQRSRAGDGEPWAVKLAMHALEVTVGRIAGATVLDEASRQAAWGALAALTSDAAADDVIVSEAVTPLLERRFDLVPAARAGAFRIGGHERAGLGPAGRIVPFVGRRRELDMLLSRFESATKGQGQVVTIVGEAGIGKSRLLYELRQVAETGAVLFVEGHCLSYGSAIPYLPVLEMLRSLFGITDGDTPDLIGAKIEAGVRVLGIGPADAAADLLQLLGVRDAGERLAALGAEALQNRTFETLRQAWLTQARRRPVALALENFHWIDRTSEAFFTSLADLLAGTAILLVATSRPGHRAPWMDKSYATQIALGPLPARDATAIVQAVLRGADLDPAGIDAVLAKAEGNPFYLEEIARAVREQGSVGGAVTLPETIHELVRARIERLPDGPREVLQAASVLGRKFAVRLLRGVHDVVNLDAHLRDLTRQEFLYEHGGGDEPLLVFKHAVTQDVASATLLDDVRRRCHGAAGRELERLYAGRVDEVVELLAHHFGRSDDDARAVDYAILAAEKAQRRWANREALAYFEAAQRRLETMPDDEPNRLRRIDAVVKQAEVDFALGRHAEHVDALEGIRDVVERVGDPSRRAAWHYWTGFLHILTGGRPDRASAHCREAVAIADASGLAEITAYAECALAQVYVIAGDLERALEAGERALDIFDARGNVWWACRALSQLSPAANYLGAWERALGYGRRALEYGRALDDLRLKVSGLVRLGSTHIQRGDPAAGIALCDEALGLSPTPFDAAAAHAIRGYGLVKLGRFTPGTEELGAAVAWYERARLPYTRSLFSLWLAESLVRAGDDARAEPLAAAVRQTCREIGYRHLEGVAERVLGECLVRRDATAAAGHLDAAIATLTGVGARNELAKALAARARLAAATGEDAAARAGLARALEIFDALGTLDEPARVRASLAGADAR